MPQPPPLRQDPLRIEICKGPADLARHAAALFADRAGRALGSRGRFAAALSGGDTPRAAYALLAEPVYAHQIVWPAVHVFFGDERGVPPEHPDSNYRTAHEALLSKVPIPPANVHRMRAEEGEDAEAAACAYEKELHDLLGAEPRLDLVLLGMGADGHTASLFPGSPALSGSGSGGGLVASVEDPEGRRRLTLTPTAINAAGCVAVMVSGASKAEIVRRVLGRDARPEGLPIQAVRPTGGQLLWLLDEAAASLLEPPAS